MIDCFFRYGVKVKSDISKSMASGIISFYPKVTLFLVMSLKLLKLVLTWYYHK